jgi:aminopeptidase N
MKNTPIVWRNDPVSFPSFPDFFLAHELAHQWWGQGVGWNNYHEQWLSEGISQYFAALYAEHHHGRQIFERMLRQMRSWAMRHTDQGPVYLGYRLGHVKDDSRVFRALIYNKGAAVMHMLRRYVGDEAFFRGIRRFYVDGRYRKVGTEHLRRAMEAESGRSLARFFDGWIYGSTLPSLAFAYQVQNGAAGEEVVLRVTQAGDPFEVPVTVTLTYTDGRTADVVIPAAGPSTDVRVPLDGRLRSAVVNVDDGTLADVRRAAF